MENTRAFCSPQHTQEEASDHSNPFEGVIPVDNQELCHPNCTEELCRLGLNDTQDLPPPYDSPESTPRQDRLDPSPPYQEDATPNPLSIAHQPLTLQLKDSSIFLKGTDTMVYSLTQSPSSPTGSVLGVKQVIPNATSSSQMLVRHLYDVHCHTLPLIGQDKGHFWIEAQRDSMHCYTPGTSLVRGKREMSPLRLKAHRWGHTWQVYTGKDKQLTLHQKERNGEWEWYDDEGDLVLRGPVTDGDPETAWLEVTVWIDEKVLGLLVTAWCTIIWQKHH